MLHLIRPGKTNLLVCLCTSSLWGLLGCHSLHKDEVARLDRAVQAKLQDPALPNSTTKASAEKTKLTPLTPNNSLVVKPVTPFSSLQASASTKNEGLPSGYYLKHDPQYVLPEKAGELKQPTDRTVPPITQVIPNLQLVTSTAPVGDLANDPGIKMPDPLQVQNSPSPVMTPMSPLSDRESRSTVPLERIPDMKLSPPRATQTPATPIPDVQPPVRLQSSNFAPPPPEVGQKISPIVKEPDQPTKIPAPPVPQPSLPSVNDFELPKIPSPTDPGYRPTKD